MTAGPPASSPRSGRRRRRAAEVPWRSVLAYGGLLAAGMLLLQWLDVRRMAMRHPGDLYVFLIAAGFLALGVFVGARVLSTRPQPFDGNPRAVEALGLSERELEVLQQLAAGRSNKEIALALGVSPNTVKTHVARVYEKLGAARRTDAVNRARELGIVA